VGNRDQTQGATGKTARGYLEEGAAFADLAELTPKSPKNEVVHAPPTTDEEWPQPERIRIVVIGAGQAGLSVGYHLARRNLPFVILDAHERIGDTWRERWDSLRLFTPARYDSLDGMAFPAAPQSFPTKHEMAAYLEAYAARFNLPVRNGVKVERVSKRGDRYLISAGKLLFEAEHVVVAMANYQLPRRPSFAHELDSKILQLHSSEYRNASQLKQGGVLIVGAGNSGAEIAKELAPRHQTWISGRDTGHVPFRIDGFLGRNILIHLVLKVLFHRVLTLSTPMGRKARPRVVSQGGLLIRVKPKDLAAAGVQHVTRTIGVRDGLPLLQDGRVLDVANVIWCTGFDPSLSWIDLPIFGSNGEPRQWRGVVEREPGLYFVGLHFLYAFSSTMIHGVGRDARYIADQIMRCARAGFRS
jgi:putative flavoprotein involved in K+ transport